MSTVETTSVRPNIECEQHHACLTVHDVPAAVDFYTTKLGFKLAFTEGSPPTFACVNLGNVQIFLEKGAPGPNRGAVYFVVGQADELCQFQLAKGAEIVTPVENRAYGLRDYTIRDLDGNRLTFGHRLPTEGPPLKIERVDLPVRLEKRLAAVLRDLAEHKRMTLTSCLEEILLHTCEPLGEGVASPHTKGTLRHIQELKRKHGIDYDCHASYRFVE